MKRHNITPIVIASISLFLVNITFAALPRYEITDLGTLGGYSSWAHAINDAGQVVGQSLTADQQVHAFLWDNAIGMIDLGTIGNLASIAGGINNHEQVVGALSIPGGIPRAFIWDSATGMVELGAGGASSINNAGQIAGDFPTVYDPAIHFFRSHACIWDSANDMIDLGTLGSPCPNSTCPDYSRALSINDAGQVVGYSSTTSGEVHAFLWDSISGMRDLGTLGGTRSWASAINNDGHIVGNSYSVDDKYSSMHAFLWDSSTGMRDLATLGGNISKACAINDHGQVVGHSYTIDNDYDSIRPFLWDSNNGMVRLDELLSADSGWTELRPQAINNWGQIVGRGITITGEYHAFLMTPVPPKVIYVDDDATGANNGSSWADAFNCLQDALAATYSGDEIRVAQGIYKPTERTVRPPSPSDPPPPSIDIQTLSFHLKDGVALKGGYAGYGEPNPNDRDIQLYETILTGDLAGNDIDVNDPRDLLDHPTRADNSYHVVTGSGTDSTAVLDGFTITAGNSNHSWEYYRSDRGSGMFNDSGSPTVTNCTFTWNSSKNSGGGMYISYCTDLVLTNCIFSGNSARWGGGLYKASQNLTLSNCTFIGNSAGSGGGMELHGDQTTLINCIFSGNSAINGGGIDCPCTEVSLTNCTFVGNTASSEYNYRGGGICGDDDTVMRLTNCIFWANKDIDGMGQAAQIDHDSFPQTHVNFCCIQGWTGDLGGIGNIDADPCFVEPGYWDANGTPNDPNDDFWIEGNYRLKSQAGRWDPKSQTCLKDDVTSLCIDAGDPLSPIGFEPFPNGGIINMGAYGGTTEASKSYFGKPPCETIVAGDINGDCEVNFLDFRLMALHWCEDNNP